MMDEKRFSEKVVDSISQRFVKISFPNDVYKEFSEYARTESADCYWLAIKQLLASYKEHQYKDAVTKLLDEKIDAVAFDIADLRDELEKKSVVVQKEEKKRTFG